MGATFSRTIRSIEADAARRHSIQLAIAVVLVAAWLAWFFLGSVAVYEVTDRARLEVDTAAHPVQARIAGQLTMTSFTIGRLVKAGEILAQLDDATVRLAREASQARLDDLRARMEAKRREIAAWRAAAAAYRDADAVVLGEQQARIAEAEALARFAEHDAEVMKLLGKDVVPEDAIRRATADAEARQAVLRALTLGAERLPKDRLVEQADRQAATAEFEVELVELEGLACLEEANLRQLAHQIELHCIRAPIDGRVGESAELRAGSVLAAGQKLGSIVPAGEPRAVAFFPVAAVGRIRPDQPARLRLEGFPWTRYGTLAARVVHVGNEAAGGFVRVELKLAGNPTTSIPVEHGLPGSVEVEVERVSPAQLVLREAARILTPSGPEGRSGDAQVGS